MRRSCTLFLLALPSALFATNPFRFSRSVETLPGWTQLELPDDVLDACRPGLPDLRLADRNGQEIPYAFEPEEGATTRFLLQNVESVSQKETTAFLDRGAKPALAQSVTFQVEGDDFLKPVVIESSDDRLSWKQIARGSLFSTGSARWTAVRFAPNDRRYLRFRFDDRNGPPIKVSAVWVDAAGAAQIELRQLPLEISPSPQSESGFSRIEVRLPAGNLRLLCLRFEVADPAYSRRVHIFERVFFRDEVTRRSIGEGSLVRSPESGGKNEVVISEPSGRNLELELENGDSPPLTLLRVVGLARPRTILFFAPLGAPRTLLYGSPSVRSPRYDLSAALEAGRPKESHIATLGPHRDSGETVARLFSPSRGPTVDPAAWKRRQVIELPSSGNIAYLDLGGSAANDLAAIRVVDRENHQVPFVVEQNAREIRVPVTPRVSARGTRTILTLGGLDPSRSIESVELSASGPEYFSRDVTMAEDERDKRGITGQRILGRARWEKRPDEKARPLRVAIGRPTQKAVWVEIENGDNAPLTLQEAAIWISIVRIDFPFSSGEELALLSENHEASPPRYDLEMVASRVLASAARPAHLGLVVSSSEVRKPLSKLFWSALVLAGILIAFALSRTLKPSSGP